MCSNQWPVSRQNVGSLESRKIDLNSLSPWQSLSFPGFELKIFFNKPSADHPDTFTGILPLL